MVAGISAPYDLHGAETADLMYNSWPRRPGQEPVNREFNTTNTHYGINVGCHAAQSYKDPEFAAGKSKRITAGYQKTGVLGHRCEEGFRDMKGKSMLTEHSSQWDGYGTNRMTLREAKHLPMSGSMVLHGIDRPGFERSRPLSPARSGRSAASGRSNRSRQSMQSAGGGSRRSRASSDSRGSHASRAPSWFSERSNAPWNFNPLPMYDRTNETYGRVHRPNFRGIDHRNMSAAGKSESGWLEPDQLIKTLTRPHKDGLQV